MELQNQTPSEEELKEAEQRAYDRTIRRMLFLPPNVTDEEVEARMKKGYSWRDRIKRKVRGI